MIDSAFALNGRDYSVLKIAKYEISLETLDSEATGRSKAESWPMIRNPQGQIINLDIEFIASDSKNPDFVYLWKTCRSMGKVDFVPVKFVDPTGEIINQSMYLKASKLGYRRIVREGVVYTESLKVSFIAQKGYE